MWTGGKDSTLVLYIVKEVADRFDLESGDDTLYLERASTAVDDAVRSLEERVIH